MSSFDIGDPTLEYKGKSRRFLNGCSDPIFSIFCTLASIINNTTLCFMNYSPGTFKFCTNPQTGTVSLLKKLKVIWPLGIMWLSDSKWSLWFLWCRCFLGEKMERPRSAYDCSFYLDEDNCKGVHAWMEKRTHVCAFLSITTCLHDGMGRTARKKWSPSYKERSKSFSTDLLI